MSTTSGTDVRIGLVRITAPLATVFRRARKERNAHLGWIMRTSPLMAADLQVNPTLMFSVLDRYVREHLADLANTSLLELPE